MYKGRNHTPSPEHSNASRMLYRFVRQVEAYFPWQSCFYSTVSLVCRPCSVGSIPQPPALPAPNWPSPAPTRHVATHRTSPIDFPPLRCDVLGANTYVMYASFPLLHVMVGHFICDLRV